MYHLKGLVVQPFLENSRWSLKCILIMLTGQMLKGLYLKNEYSNI